MSLDITLYAMRMTSVFEWNITHNLTEMADKSGLYQAMWRPEEIGAKLAKDIIPILRDGIGVLEANPEQFKQYNPENGWGSYDVLLESAKAYLQACEENPDAEISTWR